MDTPAFTLRPDPDGTFPIPAALRALLGIADGAYEVIVDPEGLEVMLQLAVRRRNCEESSSSPDAP